MSSTLNLCDALLSDAKYERAVVAVTKVYKSLMGLNVNFLGLRQAILLTKLKFCKVVFWELAVGWGEDRGDEESLVNGGPFLWKGLCDRWDSEELKTDRYLLSVNPWRRKKVAARKMYTYIKPSQNC